MLYYAVGAVILSVMGTIVFNMIISLFSTLAEKIKNNKGDTKK